MSLPSLAGTAGSAAMHARFGELAREAIGKCHADGRTLDEVTGAAAALAHVADSALDLPLPGGGETQARWSALAAVAAVDVTLGRLFEAHADAIAILADLQGPAPTPGQRWGVWAAEGPASTVGARRAGDSWELHGDKPWCSAAIGATHALVTADSQEGRALFAVELQLATFSADPASWQGVGLTGSATYLTTFSGAPAVRVGLPGAYLTRPGFWHGGAGVAAAWWGGALATATPLYEKLATGKAASADPHAAAHLGIVDVTLTAAAALLRETADAIDRSPEIPNDSNTLRALRVRAAAESAAETVMRSVAHALGPAPLSQNREHARRVADLMLYIRQSHAERDLARIGELTALDGSGGRTDE